MKYTTKKTLTFEMTLDSSEMIMFTKGGKHKIEIKKSYDADENSEDFPYDFLSYDEIHFTIQMDRGAQDRYDWIVDGARKDRDYWDKLNEKASESLKEYIKQRSSVESPSVPSTQAENPPSNPSHDQP